MNFFQLQSAAKKQSTPQISIGSMPLISHTSVSDQNMINSPIKHPSTSTQGNIGLASYSDQSRDPEECFDEIDNEIKYYHVWINQQRNILSSSASDIAALDHKVDEFLQQFAK